MLHSVTPPPPPPIVQPSKPKNSLSSATFVVATPSSPERLPPETSPTALLALGTAKKTLPIALAALGTATKTLPTANTALGKPLEVSYPQQQPESVNRKSEPISQFTPTPLDNTNTPQQIFQPQPIVPSPTPPVTPSPPLSPRPTPPISPEPTPPVQPDSSPASTTIKIQQPAGTTPNSGVVKERIIQITSDRQVYDEKRQIVTAEGNVVLKFDNAIVDADRLQVSLDNLIAVGDGNVSLTRGDQLLRGQRFTFNFVQDTGNLQNGRGDIFVPTASTDLAFGLPTDVSGGGVPTQSVSERLQSNQPLQQVSSPGGINVTVGGTRNVSNIASPIQGGKIRRLRFEADQIDFFPRGWQARNVRITNDPFSPPELVLRADKVTLTRETPYRQVIKTQRQRLVFNKIISLPIPKDQQTIDSSRREVNPGLVSLGFDGTQRGGLYVERSFRPFDTDKLRLSVTPQFFVQKAIQNGSPNIFDPALFGVRGKVNAILGPRTNVRGEAVLTSLDLGTIESNLRASLRLQQSVGDVQRPHIVNLEYSYRDRLYNGSLGFQDIQSSIGGVITSPIIPLGKTGVNLSYQAGAQYIRANTDRQDLLNPIRPNDRVSLGRIQASAALSKGFLLWQGKPLPPTATEGLRYTPNPIVPFLSSYVGVTGTTGYYTSGDSQTSLTGTVGLQGQFGHSSRPFLDYTAFNLSYSQGFNSGLSPFLFDRNVDTKVLNAGISQQLYGPWRLGFQTSINLDTGKQSSADYFLEYSRRTYGITLRYNPVLELGALSFRLSDFNWVGGTDPFSERSEVQSVINGVRHGNE